MFPQCLKGKTIDDPDRAGLDDDGSREKRSRSDKASFCRVQTRPETLSRGYAGRTHCFDSHADAACQEVRDLPRAAARSDPVVPQPVDCAPGTSSPSTTNPQLAPTAVSEIRPPRRRYPAAAD